MTDASLFTLAGLPVTAYALGLALSLAFSSALAARGLRKKGYAPRVVETFLLMAIPLGLLLSRLAYVLIRLNFFLDWGEGLALRFWQGGYSFWGALAGFLLSVYLAARVNNGVNAAKLADALAPYGLLMLALAAYFLIIFVIVGLEFAIDKTTININLIYLTMAACCLGLAALALRASTDRIHPATKEETP